MEEINVLNENWSESTDLLWILFFLSIEHAWCHMGSFCFLKSKLVVRSVISFSSNLNGHKKISVAENKSTNFASTVCNSDVSSCVIPRIELEVSCVFLQSRIPNVSYLSSMHTCCIHSIRADVTDPRTSTHSTSIHWPHPPTMTTCTKGQR